MQKVIHYPRLDTVIMIEDTLKKAELAISKSELSRRLPKQVMRQTLNVVLNYLKERGHVMEGSCGVLWIKNDNPKMKQLIQNSIEV